MLSKESFLSLDQKKIPYSETRHNISFTDLKNTIIGLVKEEFNRKGLSNSDYNATVERVIQDYICEYAPIVAGYIEEDENNEILKVFEILYNNNYIKNMPEDSDEMLSMLKELDVKSIKEETIKDRLEALKLIDLPLEELSKEDLAFVPKRIKLMADLYSNITSWGKLSRFLTDKSLKEIQINGPFIFVDTPRGNIPFVDEYGNAIMFETPEECENFLKGRLRNSGERMTEQEPLVNTMTEEGFRISCTHRSIWPKHPETGGLQWNTAVIRKGENSEIDRDVLINNKTLTEEMMDYIELQFKAVEGAAFVGQTSSGKTVLLENGMKCVPNSKRVLCIQNPTEYMRYERNQKTGTAKNNAVYWDVDSKADEEKITSATFNNLTSQTLRYNTDLNMYGELKDTENFIAASRAMNTGTKMATTWHSESIKGALDRFAQELQTGLHMDLETAKEVASGYLKTIVLCDRLADSSRKVLGIAEVLGYDRNKHEYQINYLYEYINLKTIELNECSDDGSFKGTKTYNIGIFVKRGIPSARTCARLERKIASSYLEEFKEKPIGSILEFYNLEMLPVEKDIVIDSDILIPEDSIYMWKHREEANNIGVAI